MKKKFFQGAFIIILFFISFKLVFSQELRMVASETNWSIFNPKNKDKCFVASQSIKDEAFRNGEKLSSVNRDRGKLYVQKSQSSPAGFTGSFDAGYPLKIGGKFILKIDNDKKIVFLASPEPKSAEEKDWAWTQSIDEKKLIDYLKVGNKAIMEAVSHRGTVTKDTFELTGFTKALQRLQDICK